MSTIKITLNQLQCINTSFLPGADSIYVMAFAMDPVTGTILGQSLDGIWLLDKGDSAPPNQVILTAGVVTSPDQVQCTVMVYDKFVGSPSQNDLDKAAGLAKKVSALMPTPLPAAGMIDKVLDALGDLVHIFLGNPLLGKHTTPVIIPHVPQTLGPFAFACTDDFALYNVSYTVDLT